jgi:microsomal dipeptidase-like Zn-dependent dipeptidase
MAEGQGMTADLDPLQLHSDSIVFDAHCDFLHHTVRGGRCFDQRLDAGCIDLPRLVEGGVTAQLFALWDYWAELPQDRSPTIESLRQVDAFYQMADLCNDLFAPATLPPHFRCLNKIILIL